MMMMMGMGMIMNVGVDEDGGGNHDDGCTIHFCTSAGWSLFP